MFFELISVVDFLVLFFSFVFFYCYHPLHIVLCIIMLRIFLSFYIFSFFGGSWFSYIFILLFVGGLMVVFIYISSLVPNEWLYLSLSFLFIFVVLILFFFYSDSSFFLRKIDSFYFYSFFFLYFVCFVLYIAFIIILKICYDPVFFIKSYY